MYRWMVSMEPVPVMALQACHSRFVAALEMDCFGFMQ